MASVEKVRDSNMEMLRILSMFFIVLMHSSMNFFSAPHSLVDTTYLLLINSYGNYGVSFFILISGYYGIRTSGMKLWRLWAQCFFYAVLGSVVFHFINGTPVSMGELPHILLPISSGSHWFITAYFLLAVFAGFLNPYLESISRKDFILFLVVLFTIFSLLPSIVGLHVSGVHSGKCFANLFLMYVTGRFIRLHVSHTIPAKTLLEVGIGCGVVAFIANFILTYLVYHAFSSPVFHHPTGLIAPFTRDCSFLIFGGAVAFFIYFLRIRIKSNLINYCASTMFGVYLCEGLVRSVILNYQFFSFSRPEPHVYYLYHPLFVMLTMTIAMVVDIVRQKCFQPISDYLGQYVCRGASFLIGRMQQWGMSRIS